MTEQMRRRRALMGAQTSADDPYLYKDGVISPILGGFNTTGYKRDPNRYGQDIENDALYIYSLDQFTNPGGRTFTSDNALPTSMVGKTLHVKGIVSNTSGNGGRSYIYFFVSETVTDDSSAVSPTNSSAFTNSIYKSYYTGDMASGASKEFELSTELTQGGYLSLVMYKNYNGKLSVRFKEVWVE